MKTLALLALLASSFGLSAALECYSCGLESLTKCPVDKWTKDDDDNIGKTTCKDNEWCYKHYITHEGMDPYVTKGCQDKDQLSEDACATVTIDEVTTRTCLCSGNLCNGVENTKAAAGMLSVAVAIAIVKFFG